MLRTIGLLLLAILFIPLLRSVLGVLAKALLSLFAPERQAGVSRAPAGPPRGKTFGGALRKDPVCGKYISETEAITRQVGGQTYYFCSAECRDKFHPGEKA